MFQRGRLTARLVSILFSFALISLPLPGVCQAPSPAAKPLEPAATETPKTVESKAVEGQEKEKKAGDAVPDRQKQLADDTAKLLALANELKAEMDKSTKDTLSLKVVKKAEEVEKLARKVRDEMKKSIGN